MDASAPIASSALPTETQVPEYLFSPNQSSEVIAEVVKLVSSKARPWKLVRSPPALQRRIKFKSFASAMKFWNSVADECKVYKHHPEWGNMYNQVVVRWTTHQPRGISSKDVHMAKFCDTAAHAFGEIVDGTRSESSKESIPGNTGTKEDTFSRDPSTTIPYESELSYPGVAPTAHRTEAPDLLASLFISGEQTCDPCHTGKKKSKAATKSRGVRPKDTSPHLESTEGQSLLEEMKKKRDEIDLAGPGLGALTENMETAVEKEKQGME